MAQTQVSLRNNGNFAQTTTAAYAVITNGFNTSIVSQGTSGINNNTSSTPLAGAPTTYGLLYFSSGGVAYGTNGNMLYQYNTTNLPAGVSPGLTGPTNTWDVTTFTGAIYTNSSGSTGVPGTSSVTNNYNTTSLPIQVTSGGTAVTAVASGGPTSFTVTTVFNTGAYLATDGTNLFALCPDSRIIKISSGGAPSTVTVVTTSPILASLTTNVSYGLACTPLASVGNSYFYVFDGSSTYLQQIDSTTGTTASLSGLGGGGGQYAGYIYSPPGSIVTGYSYNSINYLFVATSSGSSYYAIDSYQLNSVTYPTAPQIAYKSSTIFNFQEAVINMSLYNNTLYTLSTANSFGTQYYKTYQLSITVSDAPICFLKGTYIYTKDGYRLIETLKKGDLVNTFKDNYVAIDTIVEEEMYHDATKERNKSQLYKLSYPEYPQLLKELYITGAHSVLVGKLTDKQKELIVKDYGKTFATDLFDRLPAYLDEKAKVHDVSGTYTIYHLSLENENMYSNYGIYANGLLVESLSKNDCLHHLY